jgi:hypothetical protein
VQRVARTFDPRFRAVHEAFVANFDRGEIGAACAIAIEGRVVVDPADASDRRFGPNEGSFGHYGTGGALGFADPAADVAFGCVMNAVWPRWQNSRDRTLIDALYSCL